VIAEGGRGQLPGCDAPFADHCPTHPDGTVGSGCTSMALTEVEAFGPATGRRGAVRLAVVASTRSVGWPA